MAKGDKLTEKQELFCLEYCKDFNATRAYKDAGYSAKSDKVAGVESHKLLKNPRIYTRINEMQTERAQEVKLDAQWVLERLKLISDRCVQATPVIDKDGNETGEFKFDPAGANKATELIGKHLGMFTDKMEIKGELSVKKLEDFF